jgi:hypothetical protein
MLLFTSFNKCNEQFFMQVNSDSRVLTRSIFLFSFSFATPVRTSFLFSISFSLSQSLTTFLPKGKKSLLILKACCDDEIKWIGGNTDPSEQQFY